MSEPKRKRSKRLNRSPLLGCIYSDEKQVHILLGDDEVDKAPQALTIIQNTERGDHWKVTE